MPDRDQDFMLGHADLHAATTGTLSYPGLEDAGPFIEVEICPPIA